MDADWSILDEAAHWRYLANTCVAEIRPYVIIIIIIYSLQSCTNVVNK